MQCLTLCTMCLLLWFLLGLGGWALGEQEGYLTPYIL